MKVVPNATVQATTTVAELITVCLHNGGKALEAIMAAQTNVGDFTVHMHLCVSRTAVDAQPHQVH